MTDEDDRAGAAPSSSRDVDAGGRRTATWTRLEEIVAPGFRFTAIHLNPEPMTREQWIEAAREGYTIVSFAYESMDIDVFGDTAVVHSRYSQVASYHHTSLSNAVPADRRVERGSTGAGRSSPATPPILTAEFRCFEYS